MIYLDNKLANLEDEKSVAGKEFKEALKYFDSIGWPLRFKVKKALLTRNETEDGLVTMTMPAYHMHHTSTVPSTHGSQFWRYTPTPAYERNGELVFPVEGKYKAYTEKRVSFTRDQADLAFFLWFKSNVFRHIYNIDDAKKDAAEKVQSRMDNIRLEAIFFAPDSILKNDSKKLTTVARAYNVLNVGAMDDNQRLIGLETIVRSLIKEKKLTVDEFAESLQLDVLTELSANIQKAFEDKQILFDEGQNAWFYVADGSVGDKIIHVPISRKDDKFNFLRDYFKSDQRKLNIFEDHIKGSQNIEIKIDIENLEKLDWTKEILPYINAVGIKGTGANRKKAAVYEDIRNTYLG